MNWILLEYSAQTGCWIHPMFAKMGMGCAYVAKVALESITPKRKHLDPVCRQKMLQRFQELQSSVNSTAIDNTCFQHQQLSLRSIALERSTQRRVLVGEV